MAKKKFENVVSNITRSQRVTSISELLDDENITTPPANLNPEKIEDIKIKTVYKEKQEKDKLNEAQPIFAQEPKKTTVFRDGFSMPEEDYELIGASIKKAGLLGYSISKSEVLRAGLQALSKLTEDEFLYSLQSLTKIKPGRKVG